MRTGIAGSNSTLRKIPWLAFFLLLTIPAFSQIDLNQGAVGQKHYLDTISYQTKKGKIFVPVEIEGNSYKFLLDTGSPFLIYDSVFKDLHEKTAIAIYADTVSDINGKDKVKKMISLSKLKIGNITFKDTPGFIMNQGDSEMIDCFDFDGVIGSNMLRNSVIQIDGNNKMIILTDKKKNLSVKRRNSQKIKLTEKQSTPILKVTLQKKPKVTDAAFFDSGAESLYEISKRTAEYFKKKGVSPYDTIAKTVGASGGGFFGPENKEEKLLLAINEFIINKHGFGEIVAEAGEANERIGSKLLEYGKVTIDYRKRRFYFKPYPDKDYEELSRKPWAVRPTYKDGKIVVGLVWEDDLKENVNVGDEILGFGDKDYQSMTPCEIMFSPREDENLKTAPLKLRDRENDEIKDVEIRRLK